MGLNANPKTNTTNPAKAILPGVTDRQRDLVPVPDWR
jgi:hypothetical protein